MGPNERFDLFLIAGRDGLQELDEQLRRFHEEHRRRDGHDVGIGTIAEIEADGEAAHIVLGVVWRTRIAAAQGEAGDDGHGFGEVRRLRQLWRIGRWREVAGQANAFGVSGAIAGMLAEDTVQRVDQVGWRYVRRDASCRTSTQRQRNDRAEYAQSFASARHLWGPPIGFFQISPPSVIRGDDRLMLPGGPRSRRRRPLTRSNSRVITSTRA